MAIPESTSEALDPYDGPWKLGLDDFLPQILLLLFPSSYAEIDWSRGYEPMSAELQAILPTENKASPRYADGLYQVWRRDGREQWILLHFEVQTQVDSDLPRRMFEYALRCFERYQTEVFGYAILGDRNPNFYPGPYTWELGGARLVYQYEIAKLLDFSLETLEASDNPAAVVVLAHRYTQDSKGAQEQRRRFKLRLTRMLFRKGYSREQTANLFGILDWMLRLDQEHAIIFTREALALREEPAMSTYVNTFEAYFLQQGKQLGLHEGKQLGLHEGAPQGAARVLRSQLTRRFGELPAWASARLAAASADTLELWSLQLLEARRLEDVFA
jgi:hypothetical protein